LRYIPKRFPFIEIAIYENFIFKAPGQNFQYTDEMISKPHLAKNHDINEAGRSCGLFKKRKLLKKQLTKESKLTSKDSMDIMNEFERFTIKYNPNMKKVKKQI
jgi:hypothetical protein